MSDENPSIFQTCAAQHDLEQDLASFVECLSDNHEFVSTAYVYGGRS